MVARPEARSEISPDLHGALALQLAGRDEPALRLALGILEAARGPLEEAAYLVATLLARAGRPQEAARAVGPLVHAFTRCGDLPGATLAVHRLATAESRAPLLAAIGAAFGKGSAHLAELSAAPPPLPSDGGVEIELSGEALLDRASAALARLDGVAAFGRDEKVPTLPLFAALEPALLVKLLSALEPREVAAGDSILVEGEEGAEAFVLVRGLLEVERAAGGDRSVRLATLGPGSIFGEMALVSDAPRAASVRAAQASSLLVGSREALDSLAKLEPALGLQLGTFCHRRMISNLTRHSEILSRLPLEDRHRLIASFEPRPLAPGEALIREGDEAGGLALIASGGVEVVGRDAEGDAVRLSELGPGEVVGEISLVLRRPATADVIAIYPTLALVLARERFQDAIREYPGLLNELYEVATRRESETRTVIAQEALGVDDAILL